MEDAPGYIELLKKIRNIRNIPLPKKIRWRISRRYLLFLSFKVLYDGFMCFLIYMVIRQIGNNLNVF